MDLIAKVSGKDSIIKGSRKVKNFSQKKKKQKIELCMGGVSSDRVLALTIMKSQRQLPKWYNHCK